MSEIIVLGGGMVGVATALALQARGRTAILIDRKSPGLETSYGNAGIIQAEAVEPYGMPRDLASLLRIALGRDNAVSYHANALPAHLRLLWLYFRSSAPARHRVISQTYAALARRSTADHAPLIAAAGAEALIKREGLRVAYRSQAALDGGAAEAARLERDYGVSVSVLDGAALTQAEPAITRPFAGAVHWHDAWSCSDPGGLVQAYAALFAARGGKIVAAEASALARQGGGWRIQTTEGGVEAGDVVIALGPWAAPVLAPLGYDIPILRKRGYHRHFTGGANLNLPLADDSLATVVSPMRAGLRVLTGAEFAHADAAPSPRQLTRAETGIREVLDLGRPVEPVPWFGNRPCSPDMLPLVGRAPRHQGLWFHFGHGHQGFTLGPTTAELLAEEITTGQAPVPALAPERMKI